MFNKVPLYIVILLCSLKSQSQTGFCRDGYGNKSDPIFIENFGIGETVELSQGTSPYTYEQGKLTTAGSYHVSSVSEWFNEDNTLDDNGRALIMRIGKNPGIPYSLKIENLCPNTTYTLEFYYNIFSPTVCKIDQGITFNTDFNIDNSISNGFYYGIFSTGWGKSSIRFTTVTQNSVTFYIELKSGTECTYYLAIDDITLKACGEKVLLSDRTGRNSVKICQSDFPFSTTLNASPNYSGAKQHNYQWQSSSDGINWGNIVGETRSDFTTPSISETTYFRAIVNHGNILCGNNNLEYQYPSEIYAVSVIDSITPPIPKGDLTFCEGDSKTVSVTVDNGLTVDWYDAPTGGNLLLANSNEFDPKGVSGTYYAEARLYYSNNCSSSRTAVKVDYIKPPEIKDETIVLCENTNSTIHAGVTANNYLWSNGETTEGITVNEPGIYSVDINFNGCVIKKVITVTSSNFSFESVISDRKNIVVTTNIPGNFLYSIDGNIFQSSNVFTNIEGGLYTIYVKDRNCNEPVTTQFIHFYIPSFFTPNGDGINDFFELNGLELFKTSQVLIFDRFGKLLKSSKNAPFLWDGTYLGHKLPSDDYWCVVIADDRKFTGHFTLKR
ncbi:gliding motility-associated C-terminal domain-containing protein [Lutibacter sp. HS1-25]|uniref:T9SS type B sorting domain-containing protein n=1 Tax=Lutibacter sp. HS1-25 TaxID=2485000 RepID=UPI001011BD3A|nr:T9SS type B sorting domain-containing protein [Lutibacter sp. HS1-25]RXP62717.1 gliding motility-associated C-terminal domain-containing protein [Lutibacter sp. HS1-25]